LEPERSNSRKDNQMDWRRLLNGPSARTTRVAGVGIAVVTGILAAGYVVLPTMAWVFVRGLTAALNGSVWVAASLSTGVGVGTIVATIFRAAFAALASPAVSGIMAGLILVGAVAMFGLQRLLGSEEESPK
jgi:hypothetical protein